MNYQQALDYMFSQLPMYHRIGAAAYKADLSNTLQLCNAIGNPQSRFRSIHIAGTNGKGSVSHMLASVLQIQGLKTGLYTSPHLKDFRERIRINGKKISKKSVTHYVDKYKELFESIQPSFFEMTVGMAFEWFAEEQIDIAVIETGLGGRLDSTNIITPIVSTITNIGFDHTHFLGNTLEKIAFEKAGIIKKNIPTVIGETHPSTQDIFINKAKETGSSIFFADKEFITGNALYDKKNRCLVTDIYFPDNTLYLKSLQCDLTGQYQLKNIRTVLQTLRVLNANGWKIGEDSIRRGLRNVNKNTGLSGRWQILQSQPLCICDCAHNPDGMQEVISQLQLMQYDHLHFVIGMANDKDIDHVLEMLPRNATYYFCKANIPRGADASELAGKAAGFGLHGNIYSSVKEAYTFAQKAASMKDLILVSGSIFVVAEVV
ncbi:MAG: bifunctional folylpolyglutamate synthase/dihydrofolate synthase [Lentimicrobiaceae bacterium]|nr:bifunctional folylpolyglutamate synthase/dihydrofolate synthase [Lentimicrobiaceae bacterium]